MPRYSGTLGRQMRPCAWAFVFPQQPFVPCIIASSDSSIWNAEAREGWLNRSAREGVVWVG